MPTSCQIWDTSHHAGFFNKKKSDPRAYIINHYYKRAVVNQEKARATFWTRILFTCSIIDFYPKTFCTAVLRRFNSLFYMICHNSMFMWSLSHRLYEILAKLRKLLLGNKSAIICLFFIFLERHHFMHG